MAEREAFEARLHAAVRAYVAPIKSDLDAAQLARTIVSAEPRRMLPSALFGRAMVLVPHGAWLLLLVAVLVVLATVALVTGAWPDPTRLVVVPPVTRIAECPAGSMPDQAGPVDQERPLSERLSMAFDRASGHIVATVPDDLGTEWTTWLFDVCTNTWSWREPVGAPNLVYDWDSDLTIAIDRAQHTPRAFDLEADAWVTNGAWPAVGDFVPRLAYDQRTGLVYVQRISSGDTTGPAQALWTYDVETDTWIEVDQKGSVPPGTSGDHLLLEYDPSVDRIVAVQSHLNRPGTWLLDPRTGVWTGSSSLTPAFNTGYVGSGGEVAFDESTMRTIVFSDGKLAAYDASADRWAILYEGATAGIGPVNRQGHRMVFDAVNTRLVVAGGEYRTASGWVRADDVWAFDLAGGGWTELLAPSRIQQFNAATNAWEAAPEAGQP